MALVFFIDQGWRRIEHAPPVLSYLTIRYEEDYVSFEFISTKFKISLTLSCPTRSSSENILPLIHCPTSHSLGQYGISVVS